MRLLRSNPEGVDVVFYASNIDPEAVALSACDVAVVEPRHVGDAEYAAFALDVCRRYGIDVLIPLRRLDALAGVAAEFAAIGTALMCSPEAAVRALINKARTYELAGAAGLPVPPWRLVSDPEGLYAAVGELSRTDEKLCLKPNGEFSAFGFRILDDRPFTLGSLFGPSQPTVSVEAVAQALRLAGEQGDWVPELLVMPYLDGPEISIDCLSSASGELLVSVPRAKQGRFRTLLDDPTLADIARLLVKHFELRYLTNVQLRRYHGEPVLLEANPRPAAGIFQTAFAGVNLPWAAVRLLLHGDAGLSDQLRLGGRLAVAEAVMEVPSGPFVAEH